jgi:hypothetical protein
MFSVFDYTYDLVRVNVTAGYTEPTTGAWVEEASSELTIYGHISDLSLQELTSLSPGMIKAGMRKLALSQSYNLQIEDRIKVTEPDGTETVWSVVEKIHAPPLILKYANTNRETFLLKLNS